jgi:hypothetical protein
MHGMGMGWCVHGMGMYVSYGHKGCMFGMRMYVWDRDVCSYVCMGTFKGARGREEGNRRHRHPEM